MQNFKNNLWLVLRRPVPYVILSWRYLLPGQSRAAKLHRQVFLCAWQNLPRAAWWLIALYSYGKWYLFQGWISLFKTWKNTVRFCINKPEFHGRGSL